MLLKRQQAQWVEELRQQLKAQVELLAKPSAQLVELWVQSHQPHKGLAEL
jgi:hypothetical protein